MLMTTAPATNAAEPVALHGRTMGTTYNVRYWTDAANPPSPPDVQRAIDDLLARIDEQMSTWRDDSELSRFNAAPAGEWFPVSTATAAVVARALELHELTNGASDVTIGPVFRLWGFGPGTSSRAKLQAPAAEAVELALKRVGASHLQVRTDPPALHKDVDGLEVDLSSIAAGYAIDCIVDLLAESGIHNAMVELGGEVRGVGRRSDNTSWRIGVQGPPPFDGEAVQVIPLENLAAATSGDFHNVRVIDGARRSHIIDPRTGRAVPYRGASVTVVAETCIVADGVPTALFVMGPDAGYQWCIEHDVAALFVDVDDNGELALRHTPQFEELVEPAL
jgi:thiamine biosynthesis lipoprotein